MKYIVKILTLCLFMTMSSASDSNAAGIKWDHHQNITKAIELFDSVLENGGMTEAESTSKDCYIKSVNSKDPQFFELCAAFDITAMFIDSAVTPNPKLQRKYFQVGTVDTRLRKQMTKFGYKKIEHEDIITFWGATTQEILNKRNSDNN